MVDTLLCIDGSIVKLDYGGNSITPGEFWSAWDNLTLGEEDLAVRYCVIAGDEQSLGATVTAVTQYNSCYECLVDNYGVAILSSCEGGYMFDSPIFDVSFFGYIPYVGQTFDLEFVVEGRDGPITLRGCFQNEGVTQFSESEYSSIQGTQKASSVQIFFSNYTTCEECLNGFSAGTESESCQICWDGSGYTATVVSAPHPRWTNQFGQTVIQLDAITLGGQNGLNN